MNMGQIRRDSVVAHTLSKQFVGGRSGAGPDLIAVRVEERPKRILAIPCFRTHQECPSPR